MKVKLNVCFEIDKSVYDKWMVLLKDGSGCKSKKDLEDFIVSGFEGDVEFNDGEIVEDLIFG